MLGRRITTLLAGALLVTTASPAAALADESVPQDGAPAPADAGTAAPGTPPGPPEAEPSAPAQGNDSARPTPTPSVGPTASPPKRVAAAPAPEIEVSARSAHTLSAFRHLGVWLVGENLPAGRQDLVLDGRVVGRVTVEQDGTLEELVRFADVEPGRRTIALARAGSTVAETEVRVEQDLFSLDVSPRWVTPETLRGRGIRLSAAGLPDGYTAEANVLRSPGAEPVTLGSAEIDADGSVAVTIRDRAPVTVGQHYVVGLAVEDSPYEFSYEPVRITALSLSAPQGREIVGTGFEPGSTVERVVDGEVVARQRADDATRVRFGAITSGEQRVVLRSPAGEVSATLQLASTQVTRAVRDIETAAEQAEIIRSTSAKLSEAFQRLGTAGGDLAGDEAQALLDQVAAREELLGPYRSGSVNGIARPPALVDPGSTASWSVSESLEFPPTGDRPSWNGAMDFLFTVEKNELEKVMDEQRLADLEAKRDQALDLLNSIHIKFGMYGRGDVQGAVVRASTPHVVGRTALDANGAVAVPIPETLQGRHHLGFADPQTGLVLAWQPIEVGTPTATLPAAGSSIGRQLWPLGTAMLATGLVVAVRGARGRGGLHA